MIEPLAATALRRAVLAVSLLDRGALADVEATDAGVRRDDDLGAFTVPWGELVLAAGDPREPCAEAELRRRVARWLRLRLALRPMLHSPVADDRRSAVDRVLARVRPRALPVGHALHPGESWRRRSVLGGALDLGLALRGVDDLGRPDPEAAGLLPPGVLVAAGVDVGAASARAGRYLQDMADLAVGRFRLDGSPVLRPLGDADVPTLLASRTYRVALLDGQGMRSAAVPMRTRGWLDLGRLDPAFAVTAAELTEVEDRGFPRPVLVTADEVVLVREGGRPVEAALADPAPAEPVRPASRQA